MNPSEEHQRPVRLAWIDSAKGIAIIGVLAVHAAQQVSGLPPILERTFAAGRYGVQVFFLVSGFTIFASIRARAKGAGAGTFWRGFYLRRLLRVAPLAYLGAAANVLFNRPAITLVGLATTLAFVSSWVPEWHGLVLGGWVLCVEFAFYLLAPSVAKIVRSVCSAAILTVATAVGAYGLDSLIVLLAPEFRGSQFLYFWPPTQLPVIAAGILLYHLDSERGTQASRAALASPWTRTIAVVVLLGAALLLHRSLWLYLTPMILAFGLIWSSPHAPAPLVNRGMSWLGSISYSMFIWHFFVLDGVSRILGGPLVGLAGFASLFGVGLILTAIAAMLSHALFERPLLLFSHRLTDAGRDAAESRS